MTPKQCRAARLLLGWTEQHLANEAGITRAAVRYFEASTTHPQISTLTALRPALRRADVEFTDGDAPGVRLRRAARDA